MTTPPVTPTLAAQALAAQAQAPAAPPVSVGTATPSAPVSGATAGAPAPTLTPAAPTPTPAPTPAPAPAPAAPAIDYTALAQALVRAGLVAPATQPSPRAPARPVARSNAFTKGSGVKETHFDIYQGRTVTRYGVVVEVFPNENGDDPTASVGARSSVAWFKDVSGPMGDEFLEGI